MGCVVQDRMTLELVTMTILMIYVYQIYIIIIIIRPITHSSSQCIYKYACYKNYITINFKDDHTFSKERRGRERKGRERDETVGFCKLVQTV